jgi:hypothetical protein
VGPLDHEHPARKDNDADFMIDICVKDHPLITNRQESAGITPGIDSSGARFGGFLQHMILMMQRHGVDSVAQLCRDQSHKNNTLHGREGVSWGRPNRVADPSVTDPDVLVMIRDAAKMTAAMWTRVLSDPRIITGPFRVSALLMKMIQYYSLMSEFPLEWTRYISSIDLDSYIDVGSKIVQFSYPKGFREQYLIDHAWDQWETEFMPVVTGFLRHMRPADIDIDQMSAV